MSGERHTALVIQDFHTVFVTDAQFGTELVGQDVAVLRVDGIVELRQLGLRFRLAIDIDDFVLDLEELSGQSDTALHVVFAPVGRTHDDVAVGAALTCDELFTHPIDGVELRHLCLGALSAHRRQFDAVVLVDLLTRAVTEVIEVVGPVNGHGVACRVVEHDDVAQLHLSQAGHTAVFPLGPFEIAAGVDARDGVLCERQGERCLRDARPVAELRYEQVVTGQERLLE